MNAVSSKRPAKSQAEPEPGTTTGTPPTKASYIGWTVAVVLMGLICIAISVKTWGGGFFYSELDRFLVDHLSERSFLSKVVCPHSHDAGSYQTRELSHVLEYFEAQIIYWWTTHGHPHFLSTLNYIILFIISLGQWRYSTKYLKMDSCVAFFLVALFWTAPCILLSGVHQRLAKEGVTIVLFFLIWFLIKKVNADLQGGQQELPRSTSWRVGLQGFAITLVMTFMDQQGVFMALLGVLTLLALRYFRKSQVAMILGVAMIAAVVAHWGYGRFIGPVVIKKLTGFTVSFDYQKLPWKEFFAKPFEYLWNGLTLTLDTFRWFFGNLTGVMAFVALMVMAFVFGRVRLGSGQGAQVGPKRLLGVMFIGWVFLLIMMNMMMVLRHQPMVWVDVRRFMYYWMPATALALIAVTFFVHQAQRQFGLSPKLLRIVLAALVLSNIFELPAHWEVSKNGHLRGFMYANPILLERIKDLYSRPLGPYAGSTTNRYDTVASSYEESFERSLRLQADPQGRLDVQAFLNSSHFYNFLRSKRGYDFVQELP